MEKVTGYIAAGGIGSRLHPHTIEIPKPMLPMGNGRQRIIDFSLRTCEENCENMFVTTCYKPEIVEEHVKSNSKTIILRDTRVVGNGGSLVEHYKKVINNLGQDLLVISGDHVLENFPMDQFIEHHRESKADVTLMITPPKSFGEYVILNKNKVSEVVFSKRENSWSTIGIYLISSEYLHKWMRSHLETGWSGQSLCVTKDIIHPAIYNTEVKVFLLPDSAYWDDAGIIPRYYFNNMLLSQGENVIDENSYVCPGTDLEGCIVIGDTEIIEPVILRKSIISYDKNKGIQVTTL